MSLGMALCILFIISSMWLFLNHSKALLGLNLMAIIGIVLLLILTEAGFFELIPTHIGELKLELNPVSFVLSLYILFLSVIILSFSYNHLSGEAHRHRFLGTLGFVVVFALGLVQSANLISCWFFWVGIGWSVFALIRYERGQAAKKSAVIKRRISLFGDLCFLCACSLSYALLENSDFTSFSALPSSIPSYVLAALIVLACMTKSVQMPCHFWLKRTLVAPTPVSAILHAGVVNAGGILLIKMHGVFAALPQIGYFIIAIGALSAILGHIKSHAVLDIKQKLVYSTISQMGYVFVLCGAQAFTIGLLHIVSHGIVKASLFLNASGLNQQHHQKLRLYTVSQSLKSLLLTTLFIGLSFGFLSIEKLSDSFVEVWIGIVGLSFYFVVLQAFANERRTNYALAGDLAKQLLGSALYLGFCLMVHTWLHNELPQKTILPDHEVAGIWVFGITVCIALSHLLWTKRYAFWSSTAQSIFSFKTKMLSNQTRI